MRHDLLAYIDENLFEFIHVSEFFINSVLFLGSNLHKITKQYGVCRERFRLNILQHIDYLEVFMH